MDENHRKKERSEVTPGTSEKFDTYMKRILHTRITNAFDRCMRDRAKYILLPIETIEAMFPMQYEIRMELQTVCLGKTQLYLRNERLAEALCKLNDRHKRVLELSFIYGDTIEEIAEKLGVKEASVMQYKWEAIQKLKHTMEGNGCEEEEK